MNILVTGSNGFVGSQLMWRLEAEKNNLIGIDISSHCDDKSHPKTILGDIRELSDLLEADASFLKKNGGMPIDTVIHCAAAKHDFGISRQEYFSQNKYGTKILLKHIRQANIRKLIYFSTVSVFGHPKHRTDENGTFAVDHPYGESKLAGELLCVEWQKEDPSRELVVLRPTVIYGPHNYANMYKMMDMMYRRPWVMLGDGNWIKSIVSRANILDMTIFALGLLKPGAQFYNCVDKPYITVQRLMQIIAQNPAFKIPKFNIPISMAIAIGKIFDIPAKLLKIDIPVNSDRMHKLATATDFSSELIREAGYIQKQTIEEEIQKMTDWYLQSIKR